MSRRRQKPKGKKRPRAWHNSGRRGRDRRLADQIGSWPDNLDAGGDPTRGAPWPLRRTGGKNRGDAL